MTANSFGSLATLRAGEAEYQIHRLDAVDGAARPAVQPEDPAREPAAHRGRPEHHREHITALAQWDPAAEPATEIQFTPARVLLQDLTGVPAVVDLATMREAMRDLGGDPAKINPLVPAELVIDHSVVADIFGRPDAFDRNVELEFGRNRERFQFLRWGQEAFSQFKVVPPGTGIVHQVNIEHLARVVMARDGVAYPDTCVGTDSHTTMQNGLGRAGLGSRRHRGRGGHARPADQHADPAGGRLPAHRGTAGRGHRHRPGADHHRAAPAARRGRQVRRVLRGRGGRGAAGQPGHDRQHEPRVRLHLRDLPDRRADAGLPAADRPPGGAGRAGRGVRQGAGPVARPGRGAPLLRAARRSTCPPSSRRWPGRSGRRTGSRCPTPRSRSARRSATTCSSTGWTRTWPTPSRRPTRSHRTGRTARPTGPPGRPPAPGPGGRPTRRR